MYRIYAPSIYTPIHLSKVNNCSFFSSVFALDSHECAAAPHTPKTPSSYRVKEEKERKKKKAYRWKLPEGMESSLASVRAGVLFLCALFCYPFCFAHNRTKRRKWKINNRWRRGAMVSSVRVVITPTERRKTLFYSHKWTQFTTRMLWPRTTRFLVQLLTRTIWWQWRCRGEKDTKYYLEKTLTHPHSAVYAWSSLYVDDEKRESTMMR